MVMMQSRQAVEDSLEAACHGLLALQVDDGSWEGFNFGGPLYTALYLIAARYLSILDAADETEAIRWLLSRQCADGGYPAYPYAPSGNLGVTAVIHAAIKTTGLPGDYEQQQSAAWEFIRQNGGYNAVDPLSRVSLCLCGVEKPTVLPRVSLLFELIPGMTRMIGRRFAILIGVIFHQFPLIVSCLKKGEKKFNPWLHPLQALARRKILAYLDSHQNIEGNWAGILMPTLWGLLCLHFLGVPRADTRWLRAVQYLENWKRRTGQGLQVVPYRSEVWETALAVRGLLMAGYGINHPGVSKGLDYLLASQTTVPEPEDWQNPPPGAPRFGAWAFEAHNQLCPDPDTTGTVLWTLGLAVKKGASESVKKALQVGLEWQLAMQNPDGGWPGMSYGLKSKPPGPLYDKPLLIPMSPWAKLKLFVSPSPELGDPATADLTGRVLCGFDLFDLDANDVCVQKAIAFFRTQADSQGVWWGRWAVNYLFGSSYVLAGLAAVKADLSQDWIQRAVQWILARQNKDGGWGESVTSYVDLSCAGRGSSEATLTGQVVSALIDALGPSHAAVLRGISWLLEQQEKGAWEENQAMYVMVPPDTFYTNFIDSQYGPIEALAKYLDKTSAYLPEDSRAD